MKSETRVGAIGSLPLMDSHLYIIRKKKTTVLFLQRNCPNVIKTWNTQQCKKSLFKNVYLLLRERERETAGKGQREGDTEPEAGSRL